MKKPRPSRASKTQPRKKANPNEEAFFRPFASIAAPKKQPEPKPEPKPKAKPSAPPSSQPPSSDHLQHSEIETFAIYMAGVRALDRRAARIPKSTHLLEPLPHHAPDNNNIARAPSPDLDAPARAALRSLVAEGLRFETIDDGKQLEGRRIDTDPRELRRLRKAMYAIDGKLDLHGHSASEARAALTAFIRKRRTEGDRVLALIHGKGMHTPGGTGVLRGEIGAWLTDAQNARHVACFASAPDDLGGSGVLLVLLAR